MTTDTDLEAIAALLIERFGANAASRAYDVAFGFADKGSRERAEHWRSIAKTIEALQDRRDCKE
jgi:hypothetical protein